MWQITLPTNLPNGIYTATVSQSNQSCTSAERVVSFTVECVCPPPAILSPTLGETLCDPLAFSGRGTPGATLSLCVVDNANTVVTCGAALVDPNGLWQLIIDGPLPNGSYTAVASEQSDTCTSGKAAIPFLVSCLCTPPVIHFPSPGNIICGESDFSGSGTPGATISFCVRDGNNQQVACDTAVVDSNGVWQVSLPVTLPNGAYTAISSQTNGACTSAEIVVAFTVNCSCPMPLILTPITGDSYCQTPIFTGTGTPGATINLCVRNEGNAIVFCNTTLVNGNGNWQLSAPVPLVAGLYTVAVSQTSVICTSAETAATFVIDCTCPPPEILSPLNGSTGCGLQLMSGTALPGALVNACIYMDTPQGQELIFCGSTTADSAGNWLVPFPGLDENAIYTVTATQQTSDCTGGFASVTYTEDCHKCVMLTFFEPFIDGTVCGPVTELVGAGPPNAQLQLDISGPGGSFSITTTIDEFLSWSVTIPPLTIPGDYTVTGTVLTPPCQQTETSGFTIMLCV